MELLVESSSPVASLCCVAAVLSHLNLFGLPPVHVCPIYSSYTDINIVGLALAHYGLFNLIISVIIHSSVIFEVKGGPQHTFWRDTIQSLRGSY